MKMATKVDFIESVLNEGYRVLSEREISGSECGVYVKTPHSKPVDLLCEVVALKGKEFRVLTCSGEDRMFQEEDLA